MSTDLPERDAEGYLVEPGDWNEDVAKALAEEENIQLNDDHWDAIRFMRGYYEEHQVAACKIAGMRRPRAWSTG